MAYLERDGKIVTTHKVTIQSTVSFAPFTEKVKLLLEMTMRGESEEARNEEAVKEIREFIEKKVEKWEKVSLESFKLIPTLSELGNVIEAEAVVYTSEPDYCSPRATSILIRSSEVVEGEIYLYLSFPDEEIKESLPKGVEIEIKRENVKAEQILFPKEDGKRYVIRFY